MKLIGITGLAGSGKGTVADFLIDDHKFEKMSFADALKAGCGQIFGWERSLLEGDTKESRDFRETVDDFWSDKLERPGFTPRLALQLMGTEAMRGIFHNDIWVSVLEKRIKKLQDWYANVLKSGEGNPGIKGIVIPDVRFPNEIKMIKDLGGIVVRVQRGELPEWWDDAKQYNFAIMEEETIGLKLPDSLKDIHASEREWIAVDMPNYVIFNDAEIDRLKWAANQLANPPQAEA